MFDGGSHSSGLLPVRTVLLVFILASPLVCRGGTDGPFPPPLLDRVRKATVRINDPADQSVSSGTVIGHDAEGVFVLTARHCIDGGSLDDVFVEAFSDFSDPGHAIPGQVELLAQSLAADLALLRLRTRESMPGELSIYPSNRTAPDRDRVCIVGCAQGRPPEFRPTQTVGRIEYSSGRYWKTEAVPVPGQSGGALFNRDGYLVGVVSASLGNHGIYAACEELYAVCDRAGKSDLYRHSAVVAGALTPPQGTSSRPSQNRPPASVPTTPVGALGPIRQRDPISNPNRNTGHNLVPGRRPSSGEAIFVIHN